MSTKMGDDVVSILFSESDIDSIAWSDDGNFLAIGERNGSFHLLDANTQNQLLSQVLLCE